jgi:hypothetical protein
VRLRRSSFLPCAVICVLVPRGLNHLSAGWRFAASAIAASGSGSCIVCSAAALVQMLRRPRQRACTAMHVKPRQTVREIIRSTRLPERQELLAVGCPVGAHLVADECRQVGPDAVAVAGVALLWVLDTTREQFMAAIRG